MGLGIRHFPVVNHIGALTQHNGVLAWHTSVDRLSILTFIVLLLAVSASFLKEKQRSIVNDPKSEENYSCVTYLLRHI